jgi:hypothetical protein
MLAAKLETTSGFRKIEKARMEPGRRDIKNRTDCTAFTIPLA